MNDALTEKLQFLEPVDTQGRCDRLLRAVSEIIQQMLPKAKPSPYTKRWWSRELSELRKKQSNLINRLRINRRQQFRNEQLEVEKLTPVAFPWSTEHGNW